MFMATKLSDLVDEMSGEGHADVRPQSAKDLQETEALDSSPLPLTILVPGPEAAIQLP